MVEEEKEGKSTLGGAEGEVMGEAEEGATETVPSPEAEIPSAKKVELTEEEFAELKKKAEERNEYFDLLLRTRADFSNYQKRMKRELESVSRYATQELVRALIPAMDHLSRAIKSAMESTAVEKGTNSENLRRFLEGLRLIQNEFLKALEVAGVKNVEITAGQPFNPEFHEALLEEENSELPHHTILEMLEPGFIIYDRVLKPAKVKVSKRPTSLAEKPSEKAPPSQEKTTSEVKVESTQANQEGIKSGEEKKA